MTIGITNVPVIKKSKQMNTSIAFRLAVVLLLLTAVSVYGFTVWEKWTENKYMRILKIETKLDLNSCLTEVEDKYLNNKYLTTVHAQEEIRKNREAVCFARFDAATK